MTNTTIKHKITMVNGKQFIDGILMMVDSILCIEAVDYYANLHKVTREQAMKNLVPNAVAFEDRFGGWYPVKGMTV